MRKNIAIKTCEKQYLFEQSPAALPEGINLNNVPNPHIIIDENGTVTDAGDIFFNVVDKEYIRRHFEEYAAFSEETGVAVMLQEFGVYYPTDYKLTLEYLDDLLSAANSAELSWCGWDYFGAFSFYAVNDYEMREGANYEAFSKGFIAADMLAIYQKHLTQ